MTTAESQSDAFSFKAEIKQLLDILVHSLYQDREIFMRELISNASDALTRLHFESLTNTDLYDADAELAIHVELEEEDGSKILVVRDSGVGMTRDELIRNLGTIAQSGAREFLRQAQRADEDDLDDIIGQFGVGFYSVFMVADEVRVVSRSFLTDSEAAVWVSSGDDQFTVLPAEKNSRGTEIHIKLKEDAAEFADVWKLKNVIKKHSDFVSFPIYVDGDQANQRESLWRKSPTEASTEDRNNFYQQFSLDFAEPLATIHLHADVPVHVRALLFIPARRERNVFSLRKEPGVKLYSRNVLIQEYCTDLMPRWLEFVDGVVDSEDLPLNVSRETVQNNRLMRHLGNTLQSRVLREVRQLARRDAEGFEQFWQEYGRYFKEGLAMDPEAKEDILPHLHFHSSHEDGGLTSLEEYVGRMPEDQESIYYVIGESRASVAQSPHLEPFRARDLEVLYWVDPVDAFLASAVTEFQGKNLQNVDDASLELPELEDVEHAPDEVSIDDVDFNRFVGRCVTTLGDRVVEVRPTHLLKNSPVRLVSPKDTPNREMQRLYRLMDESYEIPPKILEVNRQHPIVINLARRIANRPEDELINLSIEQLFESALVQEGLHPNPASMVERIQRLLELASQ